MCEKLDTSWVRIRQGNSWQIYLLEEGKDPEYDDLYFNAKSTYRLWQNGHFLSKEKLKEVIAAHPILVPRIVWLEERVPDILAGTFNPPDGAKENNSVKDGEFIDAEFTEIKDSKTQENPSGDRGNQTSASQARQNRRKQAGVGASAREGFRQGREQAKRSARTKTTRPSETSKAPTDPHEGNDSRGFSWAAIPALAVGIAILLWVAIRQYGGTYHEAMGYAGAFLVIGSAAIAIWQIKGSRS